VLEIPVSTIVVGTVLAAFMVVFVLLVLTLLYFMVVKSQTEGRHSIENLVFKG